MKPRHQISRAAIDLIKRFEGYRSKAAQLADGRWTIGYGHTLTAREGAEVSEKDAEALLLYDLIAVAHAVNEHVYTPLNQNQFDALCCFAFNIGVENFRRSSVLRRINEGQLLQAACGMELWRKADFEGERIVIDALVRRRAAEKTLFLTPMEGWVPAPSPILRPNIDADIAGIVPRQTPVAVRAALDGASAVAVRDSTGLTPAPPEDDEEASPAQAAAAAVTYRLQSIFREPEPVEGEKAGSAEPSAELSADLGDVAPAAGETEQPIAETLEDLPAPPKSEPTAEPPPPRPAPLAMVAGDRAFVLTPLEEEVEPEPGPRNVPEEKRETVSDERTPSLFDPPIQAANDPLEAPALPEEADPPAEPAKVEAEAPRILIDDTLEEPAGIDIEPLPKTTAKGGFGLLVSLAAAGLALFAGGLFWAFNARTAEEGLISPLTIGWAAGIVGVALFGVAAYLVLQRLGQDDVEEDEAAF